MTGRVLRNDCSRAARGSTATVRPRERDLGQESPSETLNKSAARHPRPKSTPHLVIWCVS